MYPGCQLGPETVSMEGHGQGLRECLGLDSRCLEVTKLGWGPTSCQGDLSLSGQVTQGKEGHPKG